MYEELHSGASHTSLRRVLKSFDTDHLLAEVNAALADDQTPLRSVRVKVARHP